MPPAAASILNPTAQSFHPRFNEPLDFGTVFNNGVPSAVLTGTQYPEHDTLHNISDDALEEAFPPTADEAAEIDAMMDFVLTMSYFDVIEEQEEHARSGFSCHGKRWEVRRGEGLRGRPHSARSEPSAIVARNHHLFADDTSIVSHNHSPRTFQPYSDMESMRSTYHGKARTSPKKKMINGFTRPIHQPRKR